MAEQTSSLSEMLPIELRIGNETLDEQHDKLFCRIEALKTAAFGDSGISVIALRECATAFAIHFADEEGLAKAAGIEFLVHRNEHAKALRLFDKAIREIERGKLDQHSFLRYIEYWFEHHITEHDKRLVSRLTDKASH